MGPLILPTGETSYVYANALIHSVERVEPNRGVLAPMWEEARIGLFTLASSELVALETLIKPLRDSNARLEMLFRSILAAAEIDLFPRLWQPRKKRPASAPRRAWRHPFQTVKPPPWHIFSPPFSSVASAEEFHLNGGCNVHHANIQVCLT